MQPDSIQTLPGIGARRAERFARLGVRTLDELVHFFPRDYDDRTALLPIASLEADKPACFLASVVTEPRTYRIPKAAGRATELTKLVVADHTGRLNLTFFNAPYSVQRLHRGETYCFYGAVTGDYLGYAMINPQFEEPDATGGVTRSIVPIYPLTAGLSSRQVAQAVRHALARHVPPETIPASVRARFGLCGVEEAYRQIHEPTDRDALERARRRLVFEEFFHFSLALALVRTRRAVQHTAPYDTELAAPFFEALPFCLTGAQRRAIDEIFSDLRGGVPMSRLVQGDVGSGKTVVAAAAAFCAAKNGVQTALMAPTEILARQHYDRLAPMLGALGVRCGLLTGSMTPKQKTQCREALLAGTIDVLVGTHALFSETTVFRRLGLVIADEQHRFGVAQRAALLHKGVQPHLLIMSATPIPRTLALFLYGDLDVSVMDELPPGRQPVDTFLVDERYRKRLNAFIRKQADEGHQVFIVCPAIEESETDDLKAAEQWAQTLREQVFPRLRVALLHGKMRGAEKETVMQAFAEGQYDLLVSTTVVEVGVDVPNATLMVVENAERFGLSQLHQLRGRVGRGTASSYCVLVSSTRSEETRKRLKALCATNDGFRIAEEDLRLRGPGDFFGSRQHGLPLFRLGGLANDMNVLQEAQEAAAETLRSGEPLAQALRQRVDALLIEENPA